MCICVLYKVLLLSVHPNPACNTLHIDFLVESCEKEQFLNLINSFNLDIIIKVPTRITVNSKKAIDQIIINNTTTRHEIETKDLGYSDHDAQILTIIQNANNDTINNTRMSRVFSKRKIKLFIDYLLQESWGRGL